MADRPHAAAAFSSSSPKVLVVTVFRAENLPEIGPSSQVYCKLYENNKENKQLSNARSGPTPSWDEPFSFILSESPAHIHVKVYEKKQFKKDRFLAEASVCATDYYSEDKMGESQTLNLSLSPKKGSNATDMQVVIGLMFVESDLSVEFSLRVDTPADRGSQVNLSGATTSSSGASGSANDRPPPRRLRRGPSNGHVRQNSDPQSILASLEALARPANRPRTQSVGTTAAVVMRQTSTSDLPAGWEISRSSEGRIFFVNRVDRLSQWEDPRVKMPGAAAGAASPAAGAASSSGQPRPVFSSLEKYGSLPVGWQERLTNEGRVYFVDHLNHVTQWADPRISNSNSSSSTALLPPPNSKLPNYSRDYLSKLQVFRSQIPSTDPTNRYSMTIDRENIFESSFRRVSVSSVQELKRRLWIQFEGEQGLDYGGLTREWFLLLSREMFNPQYCLFEYSALDNYTLQISPNSHVNRHHLDYFYFIGRIVGMAIYHNHFLESFFVSGFYKRILGRPWSLPDIESMDLARYQSLKWMLENDITGVIFDTFSVQLESFGKVKEFELKPGGSSIEVTEENKKEYVDLYIKWRSSYSTEEQMKNFLEGFHEFVPDSLLQIFDHTELEYLIGGIAEIDVEDWKANTLYKHYKQTDSIVKWFWLIVQKYDNERRCRLLQFVTGTSRVPATGFRDLWGSDGVRKFTIERWGDVESLPRSHTCFNRLDLPPYPSFEQMEQKLNYALEHSEFFGED